MKTPIRTRHMKKKTEWWLVWKLDTSNNREKSTTLNIIILFFLPILHNDLPRIDSKGLLQRCCGFAVWPEFESSRKGLEGVRAFKHKTLAICNAVWGFRTFMDLFKKETKKHEVRDLYVSHFQALGFFWSRNSLVYKRILHSVHREYRTLSAIIAPQSKGSVRK